MEGFSDAAEHKGIIPNSFAHLFSHIAGQKDDQTSRDRIGS